MLNKTNEQKRLVGSKKFYNSKKVIATSALASVLVLNPVSTGLNGASIDSIKNVLSPSYVAAAEELASVNVLESVKGEGEVTRVDGADSQVELYFEAKRLVEADLLSPTLTTHFYAEEFKGLINEGGTADVTIEILPITKENVPGLYDAVAGITGSVTALTDEVGQLLDELLNIAPGVLQVNGLTEVTEALNALNNLEGALDSLTAYKVEDLQVQIDNDTGHLSVTYGDGLGQHLEGAINDVVLELLYDLSDALENLEIVLLSDELTTDNVLSIVEGLEKLPLLGDVLSPLLGEGILGQILDLLGGVLGPIIDPVLQGLLENALEPVIDALEELINELLSTAGDLAGDVTELADDLTDSVIDLVDAVAAAEVIGGAKVSLSGIGIDESLYGKVDVNAVTVDDATIDINLLTDKATIIPLDFGEAPEDPEDPEDPEEPEQPEDPEDPQEPEDPEDPEEPEQPEDPEEKPEVKDPIIEEDDSDDGEVTKDDDDKDKDGKKLPKTATSAFNMLLAGLLAMAAGAAGLFTRKRKLQ